MRVYVCAGESGAPSWRRTAPEASGPSASGPLALEEHGIVGGGRRKLGRHAAFGEVALSERKSSNER